MKRKRECERKRTTKENDVEGQVASQKLGDEDFEIPDSVEDLEAEICR